MNFPRLLDRITGEARPSFEEGVALLTAPAEVHGDILAAADALRRRLWGEQTSYVVNRNMSFTNVCYIGCRFCNFAAPMGAEEAFHITREEARANLTERADFSEVCMQGGIHPRIGLEEYVMFLDWIHQLRPDMHIHAYSAEEIHHACRKSGRSPEEVLLRFKEHGLGSVPGTAAEIFHPEVRRRICPEKIDADRWFEIHRAAHGLGLPSTATMLFGHIERPEHVVDHMNRLRDLQRETGGFTEFIPLLFIHEKTDMRGWGGMHRRSERPAYIERIYATARLFFGSEIPHLQTSWVKLGIPRALETLRMGCDDFGGSLFEERITKAAGGHAGEKIEPENIVALLRQAGYTPRRRTTVYQYLD